MSWFFTNQDRISEKFQASQKGALARANTYIACSCWSLPSVRTYV